MQPPLQRQQLARDRTRLANERTLLAYIRTALALFITGASAVHLPTFSVTPAFGARGYYIVGTILIAASFAMPIVGYRRFHRTAHSIRRHELPQ